MKPLFWRRIQLHRLSIANASTTASKTLWANLEEPDVDTKEFSGMFAKIERRESRLVNSSSMNKMKQKVVNLLDSRRSQAVGIVLSTLRLSIAEIEEALYNMDTVTLDHEQTKTLYEIVSSLDLKTFTFISYFH